MESLFFLSCLSAGILLLNIGIFFVLMLLKEGGSRQAFVATLLTLFAARGVFLLFPLFGNYRHEDITSFLISCLLVCGAGSIFLGYTNYQFYKEWKSPEHIL